MVNCSQAKRHSTLGTVLFNVVLLKQMFLNFCISRIVVKVIGVGRRLRSRFAQRELKAIASDPDDENLIMENSFDGLHDAVGKLLRGACNGKSRLLIFNCY